MLRVARAAEKEESSFGFIREMVFLSAFSACPVE